MVHTCVYILATYINGLRHNTTYPIKTKRKFQHIPNKKKLYFETYVDM